jgi:hypothetical protein
MKYILSCDYNLGNKVRFACVSEGSCRGFFDSRSIPSGSRVSHTNEICWMLYIWYIRV